MPEHAPVLPHGALQELLPGVHFVTGTIEMKAPLTIRFSRAMTVIQEEERLVLVNSVRLDEAGLAALEKLGRVTDVIRIAAFHGMDDAFYAERYGAKVWAMRGHTYVRGFSTDPSKAYFQANEQIDADTPLPLRGARLYVIGSTPPEGILLLDRDGGVAITGDSLQNWASADAYFNTAGSWMMKLMGFIKPCNVGPGWYKQAKPPLADMRGILDLPFDKVIPSHGSPVLSGAREAYRPAIERLR